MDQALELRFRPTGWGRWLEAVFLSVWLLAWAAGEAFALAMVGGLGWALISGRAIPNQPDSPMVAVLLAAFLLTFLAFWSLGGPALLLAAQLVSVVQRAWSNATHLPLVLLVARLTAAAWWGVV